VDDIPTGSDFIFSHPPYWDIIKYSGNMFPEEYSNDLSLKMDYEEFIKKLDIVLAKIYQSLLNGGRHAILVGDVRKQGKYYSIVKDMTWIGECEAHLIKVQHNTSCEKKIYTNRNFIPICHEHLLIFKKNHIWDVSIKVTETKIYDLRNFINITWRDLIQGALESLNGQASLSEIYTLIENSKKAQNNSHWKEKVRQTLQIHDNFVQIKKGVWKLKIY
jgi:hypothetical protein